MIENTCEINSLSDVEIIKEIEAEKKSILFERESTNIKKNAFIEEIKRGLGEDIKNNPNKVIINKESKIKVFLKKFFNKF